MTETLRIDAGPMVDRDHTAFEVAPVAIWQEDFSAVAAMCRELRADGISELRTLLERDRSLLQRAAGRIVIVDINNAALELVGAPSKQTVLGPLPARLITESAFGSIIEQIMAVWDGKNLLELELAGVDFAGTAMDCSLHWAAPVVDGEPDYSQVIVVIRDITDRTRAQRQMQEHAQQLSVLLHVGRQITSTLDLDTILQRISDATVELAASDASLILLFDPATQSLTRAVGRNFPQDELATHSYREIMDGVSGWAIEHGCSTTSTNIAVDERNRGEALVRARRFPGTSIAVAPIIADGSPIGTLSALNHPPSQPFVESDLSLIETLASQAAAAIQNARLYDSVRQAHQELKDTQAQLLQAQKLEAIGSLAAGIAHEINTPIQYVADNTRFLIEAMDACKSVLGTVDEVVDAVETGSDPSPSLAKLGTEKVDTDFDFYMEEIPSALEQTLEGVDRVAEIVRAMKEFAHPGNDTKSSVDLNRCLRTTAEVSRSEWKYVAEIAFDLDENVPLVPALAGPLNQALLVMIVNAAQAIEASLDTGEERGRIEIVTRTVNDHAVVRISDTGPGVPAAIVERIFDPFFTTKEVGKGSGQGLSIARSVIVDQHDGDLQYDPSGPGATFVIRLPLDDTSGDSE